MKWLFKLNLLWLKTHLFYWDTLVILDLIHEPRRIIHIPPRRWRTRNSILFTRFINSAIWNDVQITILWYEEMALLYQPVKIKNASSKSTKNSSIIIDNELCFLNCRWMKYPHGVLDAKYQVQIYGIKYCTLKEIKKYSKCW